MESMMGGNIKVGVSTPDVAERLEHVAHSWIFKIFGRKFLNTNYNRGKIVCGK